MRNKKVFVVGSSIHYANFIRNKQLVNSISEADIVLFTGGEDVNPILYNEKQHPRTYFNTMRDMAEKKVFDEVTAMKRKVLFIGICRGSQLLTVLSGGSLIQHVNNHVGQRHNITFAGPDDKYKMTSTHHQMMYPYGMPKNTYRLLAWASEVRSDYHEDGNMSDVKKLITGKSMTYCKVCRKSMNYNSADLTHNCFKEPEVVLYLKTNALAIQGHPEMMAIDEPVVIKLNEIIDELWQSN